MEIMLQKAHTSLPQGLLFLQRVSQHTKHVHCHTFGLIVLLSCLLECKADEYMQCVEQPCLGTFFSYCWCHFPSQRSQKALHPAAAAWAVSVDTVSSQGTASVLDEVACYSLLNLKVINNSRQK